MHKNVPVPPYRETGETGQGSGIPDPDLFKVPV